MKQHSLKYNVFSAIGTRDINTLKNVVSSIPKEKVSEVLSELENGTTPLMKAIMMNDIPIAEFLLECCHVDPTAGGGTSENRSFIYSENVKQTPLIACCLQGRTEILKLLVDKGVDHKEIYYGLTPLQTAAFHCREDVLNFYLHENYYTREEVCDCFELMGVILVTRDDLPSAIKVWNTALNERPQSCKTNDDSSIFEILKKDSEQLKNCDYLIADLEKAVIYSLMILEKVLGFEHIRSYDKILSLTALIPAMNISFWETIQSLTSEHSPDVLFDACNSSFVKRFRTYILSCTSQNIDSLVLKIFCKFMDCSLRTEFLSFYQNNYFHCHFNFALGFLCLTYMKDKTKEIDIKWFHSIIKRYLNTIRNSPENIFHILIEYGDWRFPDSVVYETFELCCALSETVDYIDSVSQTPLAIALFRGRDEFIRILVKYGASLETKTYNDRSIRKMISNYKKREVCTLPSSSLQILVNAKVNENCFKNIANFPVILEYFMKMY